MDARHTSTDANPQDDSHRSRRLAVWVVVAVALTVDRGNAWKDEVALFRDGNSQCNWFGCDVEDEDCDDLFWGLYERDINCHRDNDRLAVGASPEKAH